MPERLVVEGLVSTIIPVHNRPTLLREAVLSVLSQTYCEVEVIVVDDGSTDETGRVADELAAAEPESVRVLHQSNKGPGAAREAGRLMVRGEFIQYLDSDDLLLPRKFELQVAGLNENPDCGASYGKTRLRHADGTAETAPWKGTGRRVEKMFPSFLQSRWWDTPTPLYRRDVCDAAGPWMSLRLEEDWEYDCRVAAQGRGLHYCDEFVVEVRDHGEARLSVGVALDAARLRSRARAHALIYGHAVRANVEPTSPEMSHFSRELFLLSRQCGAAGLAEESRTLFGLSRRAAGRRRGGAWDYKLYGRAAAIVGWSAVGKLACLSDRLRSA